MTRISRIAAMKTAFAALAGSLTLASCASEAPARSYVQPNAIKKTDLAGSFHYLQTVTDAPPTNGVMFIGQSSSLLTIKFDVQQNFIYARRAYPQVANSEDDEVSAGPDYMGEPLAAWAISSQFDIIRQYNSTTGEQTNEIVEDQSRPWEQREFIRVDWSKNLITDYIGLGLDLYFSDGAPSVEGVSYWESDPTKPDALHMEHLAANSGGLNSGDMNYLDITDEMIVTPEMLTVSDSSGSFTYPKCFFTYEQDDCASQLVKVRHAFTKIDPQHTYEPRQWDGIQMNLFGVWDVGLRRLSYNTEYGITNTGASRKAARFNLWEQAFDSKGNLIPPANRTLRKIPYFAEGSMPITYSGDPQFPDGLQVSIYPPDIYVDFTNIIGQWNTAMKVAVQDLTGAPAPHDVFIPCHNPVRSSDDPVCQQDIAPLQDGNGNNILDKQKNPIYYARQADPRHSCVFWVNQPQAAGPLGYGPPLYDEVSGETISGQAYIYGAALETYAARSRDLMLLLSGDITDTDYVDGVNVEAWVSAHPQGVGFAQPNTSLTSMPLLTQDQLLTISQGMNFDWAKGFTPQNGYPAIDFSNPANLQTSMASRENAIFQGYFQFGVNARDTQMAKLIGTPLEKMMVTPENLAVSGVSPMNSWDDLTPTQQTQVSPIRQAALSQQIEQMKLGAEIRGVDLYDGFEDNGLEQRMRAYQTKYGVGPGGSLAAHSEDIRLDLIHTIFVAVTLHEVGHNMGCRHNFRASYDAMNYQPGYWDIRIAAASNPDPGTPPNPTSNPQQLHPRYVNQAGGKITQYEINNQIQEYQYSSIMDYGSEFNSDIQGLGLYDKAIIKFSYAQYIEVFTDVDLQASNATILNKFASLSTFQGALGFPSALGTGATLTAIPYQSYPGLFKSGKDGICNIQPPDATHADRWCKNRMDVPYASLQQVAVPGGNGSTYLGDATGNPVVPYYFCSDEFVGNLTCQRFDSGADAYEQAADIISRYKNFYLMNNFKRDRAKFYTSAAYKSRIAGRYFDILREQLTWYVLLRSDFQSQFTAEATVGAGNDPNTVIALENQFFTDENGWGNFTAAVSAGFDLLGEVITTPSAGLFYQTKPVTGDPPTWTAFGNDSTSFGDPVCFAGNALSCTTEGHTIGLLDGKYTSTTWDFTNCGYYWADECQTRIGYLIDKEIALDELSQSQAYFTGRDTSTDVRQYAIGYVVPFKSQLEDKIGALLAQDVNSLAPYYAKSGTGSAATYGIVEPSWTLDDPSAPRGDPTDPLQGLIDPATGFTLQMYAGVYALAAFPTTFDHDFIDNSRVFVVGNGEAPVPDSQLLDTSANSIATTDPTQLVSHGGTKQWLVITDANNGEMYAAHAQPPAQIAVLNSSDPSGPTTAFSNLRPDIGVRMLEQYANYNTAYNAALAESPNAASYQADTSATATNLQNFRENVQIMRALVGAYGYGPYTQDMPTVY